MAVGCGLALWAVPEGIRPPPGRARACTARTPCTPHVYARVFPGELAQLHWVPTVFAGSRRTGTRLDTFKKIDIRHWKTDGWSEIDTGGPTRGPAFAHGARCLCRAHARFKPGVGRGVWVGDLTLGHIRQGFGVGQNSYCRSSQTSYSPATGPGLAHSGERWSARL